MTREALIALRGSIKKWEKIVIGKIEDWGGQNCPLCCLYFNDLKCKGCPISKLTNVGGCRRTPYREWLNYALKIKSRLAKTPKQKKLAQAELDFLKSLLPKVSKNKTSKTKSMDKVK